EPDVGVTTSRADPAQHDERHDAGDGCAASAPEHRGRDLYRLVPLAAEQLHRGQPSLRVVGLYIQVALAAEGEAGPEVLLRLLEAVHLPEARAEVPVRVAHPVVFAEPFGKAQTAEQVGPALVVRAEQDLTRADDVVGAE